MKIKCKILSCFLFLSVLAIGILMSSNVLAETSCTDGTSTGICMETSLCPSGSSIDGVCAFGLVCCKQTESCGDGGICQSDCSDEDRIDGDCAIGICCKSSSGGSGSGTGIELPEGTGLSELSIIEIITAVLKWLIRVFLLLAFIAFIVTGIQFLLAMGQSYGQAENAKNNFKYAIIALVVVGAGYIIILTIDYLLKGAGGS